MSNYSQPNNTGRFGQFGGMYVSETLMPLLIELDEAYSKAKKDKKFQTELKDLFNNYVGCLLYTSPSPRDVEESRMPSSA